MTPDRNAELSLLVCYSRAIEWIRRIRSYTTGDIGGLTHYPEIPRPESLSSMELLWILCAVFLSIINIPPAHYTRPHHCPPCSVHVNARHRRVVAPHNHIQLISNAEAEESNLQLKSNPRITQIVNQSSISLQSPTFPNPSLKVRIFFILKLI